MIDDVLSFQDELKRPTIHIPRAALYLARSIAFPILDVDHYVSVLNQLADAAFPQVQQAKDFAERTEALSDFLFNISDFRGNREDYHDPQNSYLNCVIDRKLGIPITLGTIYIYVAQRLGMRAYGLGLPGHFIVGLYEEGQQILIDPYNAGRRLTLPDCARLVRESTGFQGPFQPKWITPIAPDALLVRMLTNLCNAYVEHEQWQNAIPVVQHLLMIEPEMDYHLRDLGYLHLYNGSIRLSAQYLEEYLRRSPKADDFENVRSSLKIVAARLALWN